ncbi:MAG TPA: hypothetical protein VMT32_09415 [Bryobacteraceae bacterium]|nr:hypothetical protein [Bryobacteraceae bacterium]
MSSKEEPGSNFIRQAFEFRFALRRARRDHLLALAATCFLISQPIYAQKRRETILQLREDVATAMAHVSLEEKQTQKLDHCRQTLLLASQPGRTSSGGAKKDLDAAVSDIEKLCHKGLFLEQDRKAVEEDIHQLRVIERNQQAHRNPRRLP